MGCVRARESNILCKCEIKFGNRTFLSANDIVKQSLNHISLPRQIDDVNTEQFYTHTHMICDAYVNAYIQYLNKQTCRLGFHLFAPEKFNFSPNIYTELNIYKFVYIRMNVVHII